MLIKCLLNIFLICFIFCGCPQYDYCCENKYTGFRIANLPKWTNENKFGCAFSEWNDWQDSGKVKDIFSELYGKIDYRGKYRFSVYGQILGIEFDDGEFYVFMYAWLGQSENFDNSYNILEKGDSFEFDCIAKFNFEDESLDKDAKVIFNKIETTENYSIFNYRVLFDGIDFINCQFKTYKDVYFERNIKPDWLPLFFYEDVNLNKIKYSLNVVHKNEQENLFGFRYFILKYLFYENSNFLEKIELNHSIYYGGMREVSIDNSNKCVNYELYDGKLDSPKYVEISMKNDIAIFTWYNILFSGERDILLVEELFI